MDTQNTPIHIKLWHKDFWRLSFANLLLMTSIYMLIIGIPYFMLSKGYRPIQIGMCLAVYGLGLFMLGGVSSYLAQRFRRNRVCLCSIIGVVISESLLYYVDVFWHIKFGFEILLLSRFVQGAFLGLAQMTLSSTLVIDSCESFQRTEANFITSWFARLSIATGPLVALFVFETLGMQFVFPGASLIALLAFALVARAKFPFKAPSEKLRLFSCDRFFLPQGTPLFINIIFITMSVGMYLGIPHTTSVFLMMLGGLLIALVAEKYVFADADLKSEVIAGLVLLGSAQFISYTDQEFAMEVIVPVLYGMGVGIMGSRFLLFYIKLAKHCQRGTSVSSFFLAWELGMNIGIAFTFLLLDPGFKVAHFNVDCPILNPVNDEVLRPAICLTIFSLLIYNFLIHPWYMKHRNR